MTRSATLREVLAASSITCTARRVPLARRRLGPAVALAVAAVALTALGAIRAPAASASEPPSGTTAPARDALANGTVEPQLEPEAGAIVLTLDAAVQQALAYNLDVASAQLDARSADVQQAGPRGAFDPLFTGYFQHQQNIQPQASFLAANVSQDNTDLYRTSIRQKLYYGASYEVGLDTTRRQTNNPYSRLATTFNTDLLLTYTQPLLRGFGRDANRRALDKAINAAAISRANLRSQVRDIARDAIDGYWDLVFRVEDLKVRVASLGLAQELLRKNRIMVDVGTLAPLEVSTAEASVAQRQLDIIVARAAVGSAEDSLRRLLGIREGSRWWLHPLRPADRAEFRAAWIDPDEALVDALTRRSELDAAQLAVENARLDLAASRDAVLPQLDLEISTTTAGLAGVLNRDANPVIDSDGDTDPTNDKDLPESQQSVSDAFRQVRSRDFNSWTASLLYTQPLLNRSARSTYAVSRLAVESRLIDLEKLRQGVTLEVRAAIRSVESARERITAAGSSRTLQRKKLDAEIKKFENGLSTNFEILTFQTDLTAAESAELAALTDYLKALAELKRSRGTLLQDYQLQLPTN